MVAALGLEVRCLTGRASRPGDVVLLAPDTRVARAGIGAERAARAARRLIDAGVTGLVSWGLAAGLDPAIAAGSLLVPDAIVAHDGQRFSVATQWRARVCQALAPTAVIGGVLREAEAPLAEPSAKAALRALSGAVGADMESAAVAREAARARVELLVIRAISDGATRALPTLALAALDEDGCIAIGGLCRAALAAPRQLAALPALARDVRAATLSLRAVAATRALH